MGADGTPLGPCLMTADARGDDVAMDTVASHSPEEWFRLTGHVPRRMDPVNRALWWRRTDPEVAAQARWFMNWHEYYALMLSGRPIVDWSDAGAWAVYDVATGGWSSDLIAETGIDASWLPEILPNATPIGPILPGCGPGAGPAVGRAGRHRRVGRVCGLGRGGWGGPGRGLARRAGPGIRSPSRSGWAGRPSSSRRG